MPEKTAYHQVVSHRSGADKAAPDKDLFVHSVAGTTALGDGLRRQNASTGTWNQKRSHTGCRGRGQTRDPKNKETNIRCVKL